MAFQVYRDLVTPIKDAEQAFAVDIPEVLQIFMHDMLGPGNFMNFNAAALVIQGTAGLYVKKVEYLYSLAQKLCDSILNEKTGEQKEKKDKKDREKKSKLDDPCLSVQFKLGNNLCCLNKKNCKASQCKILNPTKYKDLPPPIHLLSNDNEEKGEALYDIVGEVIGNKGDFALNKCRITKAGWILLPTINPDLVPNLEEIPDYCYDSNHAEDINIADIDDMDDPGITEMLTPVSQSPDEGISCPPSTNGEKTSTTPEGSNSEMNHPESPAASSTQTSTADEGVVTTPNSEEILDTPGNENIPVENNSKSQRKQIQNKEDIPEKTPKLGVEDDPLAGVKKLSNLFVRKKIGQRKVQFPPPQRDPSEEEKVPPIGKYIRDTFYQIDIKELERSLLTFNCAGLIFNSQLMNTMLQRIKYLHEAKKMALDTTDDQLDFTLHDTETLQEENYEDEIQMPLINENDIEINSDDVDPTSDSDMPLSGNSPVPEFPVEEDVPIIRDEECGNISLMEKEKHEKELEAFFHNTDVTKRVQQWERTIKPFIDEVMDRVDFDINLYGSRILESFNNNNRKQTKTFRQFCKNKEKWEIHRYFMALLPLANVGNVAIDAEPKTDGTEEILITLLSRKMHHKELEEFGHNEGSHS